MKRLIYCYVIIIIILGLNIVFDYFKMEKVLLVGDLMGFEVEEEYKNVQGENVIPTSYNTIGTMAFIKEKTNEFVAFGHSALNEEKQTNMNYDCYPIKFAKINKSNNNSIGSVVGLFDKEQKIGKIYKNTNNGIYGKVDNISKNYKEIEAVSRYKIKKGKANILINLELNELQSYDVEIENIYYNDENKNIELKITDEKLIKKTGGIIQGMSGTPLVQDGKLIGIVNYVDAKNSKKAYAIFVDKFI